MSLQSVGYCLIVSMDATTEEYLLRSQHARARTGVPYGCAVPVPQRNAQAPRIDSYCSLRWLNII